MHFATLTALCLGAFALAAPLERRFTQLAYAQFQISDGVGGNAKAQADAVFNLGGQALADVSAADLAAIQAMREEAESAETDDFDPEIAAASGAAADALQVGKIKNKVLKLTGEILGLQIEQAQGKDTASDIATETTKLNNNIQLDTANAGKASKGVA